MQEPHAFPLRFRRVPCEKPWPCAAKLVPLDAEGGLASGQAQTAGGRVRAGGPAQGDHCRVLDPSSFVEQYPFSFSLFHCLFFCLVWCVCVCVVCVRVCVSRRASELLGC